MPYVVRSHKKNRSILVNRIFRVHTEKKGFLRSITSVSAIGGNIVKIVKRILRCQPIFWSSVKEKVICRDGAKCNFS